MVARLPEGPENPNQLKTLTLAPALVTLERWMVSYGFTTQNKVADHATRRLCSSRIHLHLVPITPLHADGTYRLAPSSPSLSAKHLPTETSSNRSLTLGVALPAVVGLATGSCIRPALYGHCLVEETIPRSLEKAQPERQPWPTYLCQRSPGAHPGYVALEPDCGVRLVSLGNCKSWAFMWPNPRWRSIGQRSASRPRKHGRRSYTTMSKTSCHAISSPSLRNLPGVLRLHHFGS